MSLGWTSSSFLGPGVPPSRSIGNEAPIRLAKHAELIPGSASRSLSLVAESACWLLTNRDGLGHAAVIEAATDSDASALEGVLSQLLLGDLVHARSATATESSTAMDEFLGQVETLWADPTESRAQLEASARALAEELIQPADAAALLLTTAAILWRLQRHPRRFIDSNLGPMQRALTDFLEERNIRALWPGRARVVAAGVLDIGRPAFAVEMPTSAGKTLLMMMSSAVELDHNAEGIVVILSPSRALVSQHASDFRDAFGGLVAGLHGGLDVDLTDPELSQARIAIMTPERLDVELRRSETDSLPLAARLPPGDCRRGAHAERESTRPTPRIAALQTEQRETVPGSCSCLASWGIREASSLGCVSTRKRVPRRIGDQLRSAGA